MEREEGQTFRRATIFSTKFTLREIPCERCNFFHRGKTNKDRSRLETDAITPWCSQTRTETSRMRARQTEIWITPGLLQTAFLRLLTLLVSLQRVLSGENPFIKRGVRSIRLFLPVYSTAEEKHKLQNERGRGKRLRGSPLQRSRPRSTFCLTRAWLRHSANRADSWPRFVAGSVNKCLPQLWITLWDCTTTLPSILSFFHVQNKA